MNDAEDFKDIADKLYRWCRENPSRASFTAKLNAIFSGKEPQTELPPTVFAIAQQLINVYAKNFDATTVHCKTTAIATNFSEAMNFVGDHDEHVRNGAQEFLLNAARTADLFRVPSSHYEGTL